MYKLHFDNFLINEHDDEQVLITQPEQPKDRTQIATKTNNT